MKNLVIGALALTLALSSGIISWTGRPSKIGYAETSVLLTEFSEAVKAKKKFEESQQEWDKNLATLNDSMTAAMQNMKQNYEAAPAPEKQRMRALLEKRNDDLQRYSNAVKRMSEEKERELMDPVVKKMNAFLDQWGRKHGYSLILGTMTGGNILQADPDLNVTTQVLKDMNAHYADLPEKPSSPVSVPDSSGVARKDSLEKSGAN
jgi:outer membrane protein